MKRDASGLAAIATLTDGEYDLFRKAARTLLSRTFIIRAFDGEERLYDFAIRNITVLESWFGCADIALARDEGLGVIACHAGPEMRARLSRDETCALLVLRLIFEEKRSEITLAKYPSALVLDFLHRYRALTDRELPKTRVSDILKRLAAHRLIDVPSDASNPDGTIILYPSLALALDHAAIREIGEAIKQEERVRAKTAEEAIGTVGAVGDPDDRDDGDATATDADDGEDAE